MSDLINPETIPQLLELAEPITSNLIPTRDVSSDIFKLIDLFAEFFTVSTLPPALDRVLFSSFLTIHYSVLCLFDLSLPNLDCDFIHFWSRFAAVFHSVSAVVLPFHFDPHATAIRQSLDFFRDISTGAELEVLLSTADNLRLEVARLSRFGVTVKLFEIVQNRFTALKNATFRFWSTIDQNSRVLPPHLHEAFSHLEYTLMFGSLFLQIRALIQSINKTAASLSIHLPDAPASLRSFLESTLHIFLHEYRLLAISRDDEPKKTIPPSEMIQRLITAVVNLRDASAVELWGLCASTIAQIPLSIDPRNDSVVFERIGQRVLYRPCDIATFQRYEELKRVFAAALRDSGVFPVLSHCIMLLLELKSLTNDDELIPLVDNLIGRFSRRLHFAKLQEDQRRIPKVIRMVLGSSPKDSPAFALLITSLDNLIKLGLYDKDHPFLNGYLFFVRLLARVAKEGPVPKDLIAHHPTPSVLTKVLLRNESLTAACEQCEQATSLPPVMFYSSSPRRMDKLDLIELRCYAEMCELAMLDNTGLRHTLRLLTAVTTFIDQVGVLLRECNIEGCSQSPRFEPDFELQGLIAELEPDARFADPARARANRVFPNVGWGALGFRSGIAGILARLAVPALPGSPPQLLFSVGRNPRVCNR